MNPSREGGAHPRPEVCILLLEDSDIDAELLTAHLAKAGLRFHLRRVVNRRDFVEALEERTCEIVLADYSLPDFDGLSALNIARALQPDIPFIFVSGVVGEEFATNALKRGATDYVMKRNLTRLATAVERALEQAREREERRRTEEALHRSEMSARLAAEAAQLGLWDYNTRTGELMWDERCKGLFGMAPDSEVTYEVFLQKCHPDDRDRVARAMQAAMTWASNQSGVLREEFRLAAPDGRERWVASRGQAQFEDGVCTRLVGVARDVTEERRARTALEEWADTLERQVAERTAERDRIWRLSVDLFAVTGFDGRLRRVNPAWRTLLGYDPEILVGTTFDLLVHPEDRSAAAAMMAQLKLGVVVERFENRLRHADGTWRWMSWTAAPEGEAFYAVGRDITVEKRATEALAERNRELAAEIAERERVEQALRQVQRLEAVGQLTSGVAHDFNNLLTVILGNIGFVERSLGQQALEGRLAERIGHIRAAADRGAKLTAQMLAFSRRQKLEPKPVDLNETVAGMGDLLQSTMGGTVRVETILKPGLWPALVDPTQIELIILNLAINARDAMEVGGALTIETSNATLTTRPARPEEPPPGRYVVLTVSDTGSGMTPEVLAKAFEPFFTTKEVGKGSGLGLAQVYGFAKQSGGGVQIETNLGEGTVIRVYLPKASEVPNREHNITTNFELRDSSGQIILVVDDDSAVRNVTTAILRDLGYEVIEAGSGGAALDILESDQTIDLLVADYAMPGMSGAEVEKAARTLRPTLPVLFITGYADLTALRHIGEDRIINKPFRNGELERKIGLVLGGARTENVIPLHRIDDHRS